METWIGHGRLGLVLLAALTLACGDDGGNETGNDDGPSMTSTGGTSSGSSSTTMATVGTTAVSSTASSSTAATNTSGIEDDSTTGPVMGTEVGSCAECSDSELCMEYTEFSGPSDGGGPFVTYFCFPFPGACMDTVDCRCAGHLCPGEEVGAEASCSAADGILYCSVAFP